MILRNTGRYLTKIRLCRRGLPSVSSWGTVIPLIPKRSFAIVEPSIIIQPPPEPVLDIPVPPIIPSSIDRCLLEALCQPPVTSLEDIVRQFEDNAGAILGVYLPYESRPSETRRPNISQDSTKDMVLVAHCVKNGKDHKITLSSGFALETPNAGEGESLILTCAHTLEEIRHSPLMIPDTPGTRNEKATGCYIITGSRDNLAIYPVSRAVSSLPRSDLLLLSCRLPKNTVKTLPISPYPAHENTSIRAHFISHQQPEGPGWVPWFGGAWSKWVSGNILGYRDFSGRESKPGTYDALSHLLFSPVPTNGSSGGPIIDEESGAVIGVVLGSRMENRMQGIQGWGVPSETIYEMFSLPGLGGKK